MKVLIDYTGKRFGKLVVIERAEDHVTPSGFKTVRWKCRCDCGGETTVLRSALQQGATVSCGCHKRSGDHTRRHGLYQSLTYKRWLSMRQRCINPNTRQFDRYGGRGIKFCDRWNIFENFLADMGECPAGMTLERKNNDGHYTPKNCKWATYKEQSRNKSTSRFLTVRGETITAAEWSERTGISPKTLHSRLRLGWSEEDAVLEPVVR